MHTMEKLMFCLASPMHHNGRPAICILVPYTTAMWRWGGGRGRESGGIGLEEVFAPF